jgi:hypothetical protein
LDDISFDDEPLQEQAPAGRAEPPAAVAEPPSAGRAAPQLGTSAPRGEGAVPDPLVSNATSAGIAYITVADASGRVLFRRPATAEEVDEALRASDEAEREGQAAMDRIASERFYAEALEKKPQ